MTKYLIFSIVGTQGSEKWLLSDKEATFFNIKNYFGAGDIAEWLSTWLAYMRPLVQLQHKVGDGGGMQRGKEREYIFTYIYTHIYYTHTYTYV